MNELIIKLWSKKSIRNTILVVLALMAAVSLVQGIRNAAAFSQDFQWDAAKVLSLRIDPYVESICPTGILDEYEYDKYYLQMEANQFPSLLMLLFPLLIFEPLTARHVWIACNLFFTVGIIFLLRKTFLKSADKYIFILFSLLMIAGTPYRNQLGVGQHTLFSFFFFLLAVYLMREDKQLSIGTTLALFICYFKYTLTVPLCLYFIYKKKYKEIIVSAVLHVILTGVAAIMLNKRFIDMIIEPLKVAGNLKTEGGIDLSALLHGSSAAFVIAGLIMISWFIFALRIPTDMDGTFIAVLTLWSMIITYHRTYDFFVIILVLALFLEKKQSSYLKWGYAAVLVSVFFVLRIFSESLMSRIVVGCIYYVFTIVVSIVLIRQSLNIPIALNETKED